MPTVGVSSKKKKTEIRIQNTASHIKMKENILQENKS